MKYLLVVFICITCLSSAAYCPNKPKEAAKPSSNTQLVDRINFIHLILI